MRRVRSPWLLGLSLSVAGWTGAAAQSPAADCSNWTLDGYHIGMRGDALLAVRSVTLHVEGQAQAIEPGKFSGALVLDALNRLQTWDVAYVTPDGDGLRNAIRAAVGEPVSDVSGTAVESDTDTIRQRRTIWLSTSCDAAIIVYENTSVRGTPAHSVNASLTRASGLPKGLVEAKTLLP